MQNSENATLQVYMLRIQKTSQIAVFQYTVIYNTGY